MSQERKPSSMLEEAARLVGAAADAALPDVQVMNLPADDGLADERDEQQVAAFGPDVSAALDALDRADTLMLPAYRRSKEVVDSGVISGEFDVPAVPVPDELRGADEHEPRHAVRAQLGAPDRVDVRAAEHVLPSRELALLCEPEGEHAERYRYLATHLRQDTGARLMAITSPTAAEFSHLVTVNLALGLAESRRTRVVLVDGNLRRPALHRLFELREGAPLAEQIRRHRRDPSVRWETLALTANLSMIPAGAPERNPAALLNSESMQHLFRELSSRFDFVIVATAPILETADASILQPYVDGIVLVVRAGVTRAAHVRESVARLGRGKFLGAVLTGM